MQKYICCARFQYIVAHLNHVWLINCRLQLNKSMHNESPQIIYRESCFAYISAVPERQRFGASLFANKYMLMYFAVFQIENVSERACRGICIGMHMHSSCFKVRLTRISCMWNTRILGPSAMYTHASNACGIVPT